MLRIPTATPLPEIRTVPFFGNSALVYTLAAPTHGTTLIIGEPGAGKSRLLEEGRRLRRARGADVVWVACLRAATDLPFDPLVTLTKRLQAQGRLSLRAQRAIAATSESRKVRHLCDALERAATEAPLAVQMDDLHLADSQTLQALHYCVDRLSDLPLAWNLATRPGYTSCDEFGAMLARAQLAAVIELDGLSFGDAAAFVRSLDPSRVFDDEALAQLYERTGGNPLYIELLVREGDNPIAPNLRRELTERLQALPPDAIAVAESLAKQNLPLDIAQLASFALLSAPRAAAALAALVQGRVLRRTSAGFAFRHGALRDACYDWFGGAALSEHAGEHANPATLISGTWETRMRAAATLWETAPDHDAALPLLERVAADPAAQLSESLPRVLFMLGASYEAAGQLQRAREPLERALAMTGTGLDESLAVRLYALRAAVEGRLGNPHEGLAMLAPVAERAAAKGLNAEAARCCTNLCTLSEMIADAAGYEHWCRFGLATVGSATGSAKADLLCNLARVELGKGRLRESLAIAGQAADAASEPAHREHRSSALCLQAQVHAMLGDFSAANGILDEATHVSAGARSRAAVALAHGTVDELQGNPKSALTAYMTIGGLGHDGPHQADELAALTGVVRCACDLRLSAQAHDALDHLRAASRLGWTLARRSLHQADGFVALLDGDATRGASELMRATELEPEPFWRARLLLRVAEARNDRKLFLDVIGTLDAMESQHAADLARTTARAHGLRPGRKRESRDTLSSRESSVAVLLATGMTNSEIGALLHITARTVEYHVGNILTKCGLRSRVEVATRVAAGELDVGAAEVDAR